MGFDDVAERMKERRHNVYWQDNRDRGPLPDPIDLDPVTPQSRRSALVLGWSLLVLGLVVVIAAGIALLLSFSSVNGWRERGLVLAIAVGSALVYYGTRALDEADRVVPLPDAHTRV